LVGVGEREGGREGGREGRHAPREEHPTVGRGGREEEAGEGALKDVQPLALPRRKKREVAIEPVNGISNL